MEAFVAIKLNPNYGKAQGTKGIVLNLLKYIKVRVQIEAPSSLHIVIVYPSDSMLYVFIQTDRNG